MASNISSKKLLWRGFAPSALSGILLIASMPGFNVPFIGWLALVSVLAVLLTADKKQVYLQSHQYSWARAQSEGLSHHFPDGGQAAVVIN